MDAQIALILIEDGIASGAIYALLALTIVLVFATTRILLVSQGEFVTFAALSFASFQLGVAPPIVWLVAALAVVVTAWDTMDALREGKAQRIAAIAAFNLLLPAIVIGLSVWAAPLKPPVFVQAALSVAIVTALGPQVYRVAFQPVAGSTVRMLFVIAIALHFVLQGVGLLFFGADGFRADPLVDIDLSVGTVLIKAQTILSLAALGLLTAALYVFFEYTLLGKALRATAINRVGARLVGIRTPLAGKWRSRFPALSAESPVSWRSVRRRSTPIQVF
jgi:branched-chain amino acid transport system permease protein